MDKQRKSLLDFCYIIQGYKTIEVKQWLKSVRFSQENCGLINIPHSKGMYALFYDEQNTLGYKGIVKNELSNEVSLSSIPENEKEAAYLFCNQDGYSKYCKEYKEYWDWIDKRNEERYNTNQKHGKNYDSKNMMHTIRLLQSAEQILKEGTLNIKVNNREELLSIKAGNMEYDQLLEKADSLITSIETEYLYTNLPDFPNKIESEKLLVEIRKELYEK